MRLSFESRVAGAIGLSCAAMLGWVLAFAESREASQLKRVAREQQIELDRRRSADGLLADLAARIRETQRRAVELELERRDAQAALDGLRRELRQGEAGRRG